MVSPQAGALLAAIRGDIQRYGQSIIPCDQLLVLVCETDPIQTQFGHIFQTAVEERWSFEFRQDGTVRFASLEIVSGTIEESPPLADDPGQIAQN